MTAIETRCAHTLWDGSRCPAQPTHGSDRCFGHAELVVDSTRPVAAEEAEPAAELEPPAPPHPADEHDGRPNAVEQLSAQLLHGDDIENLPPPTPLIDGWLDLNTINVLFGKAGSGKSFVALDIANSVATGSWWHGHEVTAGDVLYVVAEGAPGMGKRQRAWKQLNRHYSPVERMHWLPRPVNLLDVTLAYALAEVAATIDADGPPRLVVVDTLARSMPGGEENNSRDMSLVIAAADQLRTRTGACVLLVHHSGKDEAQGARGHSSLFGAINTELHVRKADNVITLANTKQKDAVEQPMLRFVLAPVAAADSVAIAPYTGRQPDGGAHITRSAETALAALESIALEGGATNTAWRDIATSVQFGVSRSTFMQAVKTLVEAGMVQKTGTPARPLYSPVTRENT